MLFRSKNSMDDSEILKDRKKTKHFIGLYPDEFDVFDFLGPAKYELNYWDSKGKTNDKLDHKKCGPSRRFTAKDKLFITLLRLRRGFVVQTIAYMFDMLTWIQFLFLHFKSMENVMFAQRDVIQSSLPKVF